jgi:nucleoside-diphosphate-sugar epimerase
VNPEVLIIGCGFLGEAAAELFFAQGRPVLGVVRSAESREKYASRNFETALCDVTSDQSVEALRERVQGVPLAIYSVSSGGGSAAEYAIIYRDSLKRVLQSWRPQKVVFVSSSSVYGQNDGSWVTEESPALPEYDTASVLLEAEDIALANEGIVARFTGIYGPGRSMQLRKFLGGEAVLEAGGNRYLNQIHRDDGAFGLLHLADLSVPPGIYNVTDDTPATQRELYGWMANFLQLPLPPEGPVNKNRKRGVTSKRVSNSKLRSLGWRPKYPAYRDALPSLMS